MSSAGGSGRCAASWPAEPPLARGLPITILVVERHLMLWLESHRDGYSRHWAITSQHSIRRRSQVTSRKLSPTAIRYPQRRIRRWAGFLLPTPLFCFDLLSVTYGNFRRSEV